MTPTTSTHGPESDDGRQDAPGVTPAATEAREALDLDAIETRAKAATPGPWHICDDPGADWADVMVTSEHHDPIAGFDEGAYEPDPDEPSATDDAEHIAGMDPATTLALVRELREARADRDDLRARLAKVEADLIVSEADRDRYKDAFLRANEACTVREAAILDLQAERDSAEAHASVACEAETRLAKVEAARGALGTVRRTAPRTLYDQGYQDGQTDERAVIAAALDAALGGDR